MSEVLQLRNISKTFPGVLALQNISFDLNEGEVHCLCGENGAGKSTLIKILSGAYQPDEGGEIVFDGRSVVLNPHLAMKMGIQTIYQEHIVFENLNITENIFIGSEIAKRGVLQKGEMRKKTVEVLKYLKSDLSPEMKMGELSSGEQKTVERPRAPKVRHPAGDSWRWRCRVRDGNSLGKSGHRGDHGYPAQPTTYPKLRTVRERGDQAGSGAAWSEDTDGNEHSPHRTKRRRHGSAFSGGRRVAYSR
jgi:ABC-type ATPase involved in cell division